jgi:hypothetical protein
LVKSIAKSAIFWPRLRWGAASTDAKATKNTMNSLLVPSIWENFEDFLKITGFFERKNGFLGSPVDDP